jgi:lipoprotein-anchoring transpeptidase ErfK/SrfK|tara:strand:- start:232 stop:747 length:516 start_codon:yes stop_codon:yes gene_type:complete
MEMLLTFCVSLLNSFKRVFLIVASRTIVSLSLLLIFEPSLLAAEQTNKSTRSPSITVEVSLSGQTMKVYQSGVATHEWLVSTARQGKVTPKGAWTAKWLSKNHKSSRYNNAPMPYSIFYNGNFAVHGTYQVDRLGSPASAGCIRLHPKNAAVLFALVDAAGLKNTTISVVN